MSKRLHPLLWALPLVVSACGDGSYSDLEQFVRDSGKDLHGKVTPLPVVRPYEHFAYDAFDIPDPFRLRRNESLKGGGGGLQPDLNRRREVLESFSLESLKMVGSIQQNKATYALIKTPDNALHRVRAGNYLGQNFGLVIAIQESEVKLKEIVQDSAGEWVERISTLMLEDQEQNK